MFMIQEDFRFPYISNQVHKFSFLNGRNSFLIKRYMCVYIYILDSFHRIIVVIVNSSLLTLSLLNSLLSRVSYLSMSAINNRKFVNLVSCKRVVLW
jgi:hypothetical protein